MNKSHFNISVVFLSIFLTSCSTVPLTGRMQLDMIPADSMLSLSFQQYDEFLKTNKLSADQTKTKMVKSVGEKIQKAVEKYMAENGLSDRLQNYQWEFNLVENDEANAWCMPGGKVVVYTGILPITKDENGLATVMGHEIAHAIAKHGDERMSQGLLAEFGNAALSSALQNSPDDTRALWMGVFGAGAQYGILLPFSRVHETEADRLGLIFMAMAGFDPSHAVSFWERMSELKKGKSIPEFLSSHPSDENRIREIKSQLPEAMVYYKKGTSNY
ncbi:MAG: M48 family metallopeptidase [Candidatus Omnitrophica bacterium]|nr:M48 family metallopeptidase [Candidatus Omnitrophota bacterium]